MTEIRRTPRPDATGPRPVAVAAASPRPAVAGDQLRLSRPAPAAFSWDRGLGHFWAGFKAQARDTWDGIVRHPIRTAVGMAGFAGLSLAAAYAGISPVAMGNAAALLFGAFASFRFGRAVVEVVAKARGGDMAAAERAMEGVGRGGFEVALTVGPTVVGKAASILRRTEAGAAVAGAFKRSAAGQALADLQALPGKAWRFVRGTSDLTPAAGEGAKVAAAAQKARTLTDTLARFPRLAATKARLDAWRLAIAESGTVRGFNFAFETIPSRIDGWAITKINYSGPGRAVRDWGIARMAASGNDPHAVKMLAAVQQGRLEGAGLGEPITRFGKVSDQLYRGSAPTTAADFELLVKQKNVKTIVSLLHPENPKEVALLAAERQLAAQYGIEVVNIPLPFGVDPPPAMVARFLQAVDQTAGSVYVHCRLGRDRTGTMVAVYQMARQGLSNEQAAAEMAKFGFDPKKDTYLQYLADYVAGFGKGLKDRLGRFFLVGSGAEVAAATRQVLPGLADEARR